MDRKARGGKKMGGGGNEIKGRETCRKGQKRDGDREIQRKCKIKRDGELNDEKVRPRKRKCVRDIKRQGMIKANKGTVRKRKRQSGRGMRNGEKEKVNYFQIGLLL